MKNEMKVPESLIQAQILTYLKYNRILAYRINSGMIKTEAGGMVKLAPRGFADIVGVLPGGRALFIEVKTGKNKTTIYQDYFLEEVKKQGALAFVAYSIEDCEYQLKSRGKVTAGKRL
jgi:hypothetical protein